MSKFTDEQLAAIAATGRTIVSASAGSGKTTVMIEKMIRLILDKGVDVTRILAVTYTKKAAASMKDKLRKELGLTILFVAHDLSVVKYFSDRIAVMNRGRIVEMAPSDMLYNNPIHPYTKSLLSAIPIPNPLVEKKRQRFDYDPSMHNYSEDNQPRMIEVEPEHFVFLSDEEVERYAGKK